jgi:hypothetical protein
MIKTTRSTARKRDEITKTAKQIYYFFKTVIFVSNMENIGSSPYMIIPININNLKVGLINQAPTNMT